MPSRANDLIFGRPVLERLMIQCERAGIRRFVIEAPAEQRDLAQAALGSFRNRPEVGLVDSLTQATQGFDPSTACVHFAGNLVLAQSQLRDAIAQYRTSPGNTLTVASTDPERGGAIVVGPLGRLLDNVGSSRLDDHGRSRRAAPCPSR